MPLKGKNENKSTLAFEFYVKILQMKYGSF